MIEYTDYLEDTVWCNDRSMSNQSSNGWNPNGGSNSTYLYFGSVGNKSSLTCSNKMDSFTVDSANGNGSLTYPVGLLTEPERSLASSSNSPLTSGATNWLLSPIDFNPYHAGGYVVDSNGGSYSYYVYYTYGVRPVVSLRSGIIYESGDGTVDTPYIVAMSS